MPPFDPRRPAPPVEEKEAPRKLVTTGGVEVNVKAPPLPEPATEPEPRERSPDAIIVPEGQSPEERRAFLNALCEKHVKLVEDLLDARKDVLEESRKDLRQRVLVILCKHVEDEREVPRNMRAFLREVVRKEVKNHKGRFRPPIQQGADAESVPASGEEAPEETAKRDEQRLKLERYLTYLPEVEAEVVRCVDLFGLTIEEAAVAVRRPESTVFDQLERGRGALYDIARASERPRRA